MAAGILGGVAIYVEMIPPFLLLVSSLWRDADGMPRGRIRAVLMASLGAATSLILLLGIDYARVQSNRLFNSLPPGPITIVDMPDFRSDGGVPRLVLIVVSHDPRSEPPLITRKVFARSVLPGQWEEAPYEFGNELDPRLAGQGTVVRWSAGDSPVMALKRGEPYWLEVEFSADGGRSPLMKAPSRTIFWLDGTGVGPLADGWVQRSFIVDACCAAP